MLSSSEQPLLTARETADRLGVKLDTLYAYVSRGLLSSVTVGGRERRYRIEDVERFRASRGHRRDSSGPPEALVPVLGSSISLIEDGRLYYRGKDAICLAGSQGPGLQGFGRTTAIPAVAPAGAEALDVLDTIPALAAAHRHRGQQATADIGVKRVQLHAEAVGGLARGQQRLLAT